MDGLAMRSIDAQPVRAKYTRMTLCGFNHAAKQDAAMLRKIDFNCESWSALGQIRALSIETQAVNSLSQTVNICRID